MALTPKVIVTSRPANASAAIARRSRSASADGSLAVGAGDQDQELLAAEPVGEVEGAQLLADRVGDVGEHRVADRVPEGVVDALEVIEVAEHDPDRLAGQLRLLLELERAAGRARGG